MSLTVLEPGLLTTVQDLGRYGYQQFGVSISGAADAYSAKLANILTGNPMDAAVLECTFMGPKLRFDSPCCIAVTGGDLGACLNGRPMPTYTAVVVPTGAVLSFTGLRSGLRAYIAFSGGLDIAPVMGSASTDLKAHFGGFKGRKLQAGDVIPLKAPGTVPANLSERHITPQFTGKRRYRLRVLLGPQDDMFTEEGLANLFSGVYTVTGEHDRMGIRLSGREVTSACGYDIISDGIAMGAIEITSASPIIMLSDRQSAGGYPKPANVISADFRILGQLKAGDKLTFTRVTLEEATELLLQERRSLAGLEQWLSHN